jgi:hypothetical protein
MLYVNGDSWSFQHIEYDFDVWPNIIAQGKNWALTNDSVGCGSNSRIIDNLLTRQIMGMHADLVIIGLTAHHRFHIPSSEFGSWSISPTVAVNDRSGQSDNSMIKHIYSKCFSEINSVYRYYRDLWQINKIASDLNTRCMMFQMWDKSLSKYGLLKSKENIFNFVERFYEPGSFYYNEYVGAFNNLQLLSRDWEYWEDPVELSHTDLDATYHPNESGHKKIANFIESKI